MRRICQETDPELWFPRGFNRPNLAQIEQAKAECGRCPALAECRSQSLDMAERLGVDAFRCVMAGMTPRELVKAAADRRAERAARLAEETRRREEGRTA